MKKLFLSIVAVATMLVFTSCTKDNETPPTITVPATALTIDLGDEKTALEGVTAKDDKDVDVTSSLRVEGLNFVGVGTLTYSAEDKTGLIGTLKRPVTIKPDKLFGTYKVTENEVGGSGTDVYDVTAKGSIAGAALLVMENFGGLGFAVTFAGDGESTTLTMMPQDVVTDGVDGVMTGTISYTVTNGYLISNGQYKIVYDDGITLTYTIAFTAK
jgi:hypothetical protein